MYHMFGRYEAWARQLSTIFAVALQAGRRARKSPMKHMDTFSSCGFSTFNLAH
jgi:hypothetical protein